MHACARAWGLCMCACWMRYRLLSYSRFLLVLARVRPLLRAFVPSPRHAAIDVSTYADQMDAILAHEIELIQSFRKRLESHVSK